MQILILMGPHSKVREIALTTRHLVFGCAGALTLVIGAGLLVNSVTTETKDILHAMEKKRCLKSALWLILKMITRQS